MTETLFKNAHVLTMDDDFCVYKDGYVLVRDDEILSVGDMRDVPETSGETIDCNGGLLLPGFVNLHCHAAMVPFRTMGDDCPDRLRRFLFPLENEAITPELVYLASRFAIAEMLLSGITTFVDMYYFEEEVARACEESGMRGYLGETVISQPSPSAPGSQEGLRRTEALLRASQDFPSSLVRYIVAPHGTTTVDAEVLRACHALAEQYDTLLTLHVSEMDYEMAHFASLGTTPLAFLDSLGAVSSHLLAAHCIHLTDADIDLLHTRGARVAHCIGSNAKAGKGIAPMADLAEHAVPFGFGTDGPSSGNTLSIFDQMRLFALTQKTRYHNRALFPAREIVRAATRGAAECLHAADRLGQIRPGYAADITVVGLDSPHLFPLYNPYSALVYAASSADVRHVMVSGRLLVRDRILIGMDLAQLRCTLLEAMGPFMAAADKYRDII
ncbi:MAG: amidohydrolase [Clostridia bacterium]|nr:amidohydrolase [Clostridia bacterium]MBR1684609.1 amidohydrolase [Clostridia bacterium]